MTTAIAIEDVRREVKILKALSGHPNTVKFYDAFEDALNIYIVMEYVFHLLNFEFFVLFYIKVTLSFSFKIGLLVFNYNLYYLCLITNSLGVT